MWVRERLGAEQFRACQVLGRHAIDDSPPSSRGKFTGFRSYETWVFLLMNLVAACTILRSWMSTPESASH